MTRTYLDSETLTWYSRGSRSDYSTLFTLSFLPLHRSIFCAAFNFICLADTQQFHVPKLSRMAHVLTFATFPFRPSRGHTVGHSEPQICCWNQQTCVDTTTMILANSVKFSEMRGACSFFFFLITNHTLKDDCT